jgi:hypothetical protein
MEEKGAGAFAVAEMRNEKTYPSTEGLAFMDDRTRYHLCDIEYHHSLHERMRPTKEERDLRSRLRSSLIDKLGVREEYERLRRLVRDRADANRHFPHLITDEPGASIHPFSDPDEEVVTVWWAKTSWFFPPGEATMWMDGDGVHVAAHFESDDGDLHKPSIRVVAQYEVGPNRMPPKGRRYLSNPVFDVSGPAYGFTAQSGFFDFGDSWSKCWLNMKQTVFTVTGFDGIIRTLASNTDSRTVIFTEDGDAVHANLPGLMGLPVEFFLPENADALIFELEWRFDIQIEDGLLYLGHRPEAQVCTIRHPQWPIRAL